MVAALLDESRRRPECLSYHLLRPRETGPADVPLLGEAYRCWSSVWKDTFLELDNQSCLSSDDFTRKDEVGALFHGYECVALSMFRWIDLSNPIYHDDSYFAVWSEEARRAACAHGSKICISSSFTIAPSWRCVPISQSSPMAVMGLLAGLIIERFLVSDADALIATVRNDRGMNKLAYGYGFHPLVRNATLHHVPVDLVVFHRATSVRGPLSAKYEAILQRLRPRGDHR